MLNNTHGRELTNQKKFQLHIGTGSWGISLIHTGLELVHCGKAWGSREECLCGQYDIWGDKVRSHLPFGAEGFKYFNKYTAVIVPPDLMLIAINGSCLPGLWR